MIQTFGQSLDTLRSRLQQCSLNLDQKDREISCLKATIESLRRETSAGIVGNNNLGEMMMFNRREKVKKGKIGKELRSPSSDREESSGKWFRGSIVRAFKRNRSLKSEGFTSDSEIMRVKNYETNSMPGTPTLKSRKLFRDSNLGLLSSSQSAMLDNLDGNESELVNNLRKQLLEKERQLNEIRLEALLTASQLESMNDQINIMNKEMNNLRSENQRLQNLLNRHSINSSMGSLNNSCQAEMNENSFERRIFLKLLDKPIGFIRVNHKTCWNQLDANIKNVFDQFLRKIDSQALDLSIDSLSCYYIGTDRIERRLNDADFNHAKSSPINQLLRANSIEICLCDEIDNLTIETSTPKSVLNRIINVLQESKRLIICGYQHCGKSYIAFKCAQLILKESAIDSTSTSIASVNVKSDNHKEIQNLIHSLLVDDDQSNQPNESKPKAIIFKNIHNLVNFSTLLPPIRQSMSKTFPLIICTMSTGNGSLLTNMQIYHHFQTILYSDNSEPCKNLISRVLRKKSIDCEINAMFKGCPSNFAFSSKLADWLQQLYFQLINFMQMFTFTKAISFDFGKIVALIAV